MILAERRRLISIRGLRREGSETETESWSDSTPTKPGAKPTNAGANAITVLGVSRKTCSRSRSTIPIPDCGTVAGGAPGDATPVGTIGSVRGSAVRYATSIPPGSAGFPAVTSEKTAGADTPPKMLLGSLKAEGSGCGRFARTETSYPRSSIGWSLPSLRRNPPVRTRRVKSVSGGTYREYW